MEVSFKEKRAWRLLLLVGGYPMLSLLGWRPSLLGFEAIAIRLEAIASRFSFFYSTTATPCVITHFQLIFLREGQQTQHTF